MKSHHLILAVVLLAIGGFLGWALGPSSGDLADDQIPAGSPPTKSSRSFTSSSRSGSHHFQMRAIRDAHDEGDRMRHAMELAKTLPLNQAGRWLDEGLFSQREGYALTLFTKILEQRWRTEDPDGYLVWQLGNGRSVSKEEMARLADRNPDLLLVNIRLIEDPDAQGAAIANLAKARPDLALAELARMDLQQLQNSGRLRSIFGEMAKTDLAGLQSHLDDLPNPLREAAQQAVFSQLLITDFSGAVSQLVELPNGLDILRNANLQQSDYQHLLEKFATLPQSWKTNLAERSYLLTAGMNSDQVLATDWASYGLSEKQFGRIRGHALFNKASKNKEGALELFQNNELNEAGRRYFLDLLSWNEGKDIIQDLLPHLESADHDYISKKLGESGQSSPTLISSPRTAADLSQNLANPHHRNFSKMASSMRNWNAEQKRQFQRDYAAMQGEDRHLLTAMLTNSEDLDQRAVAVQEILGNAEAQEVAGWSENQRSAVRAASEVALEFLKQDADQAARWVTALPEGDTRTWTMKNLAANWHNYDPAGANRFVESLPASEREAVSSFIENPRQ